MRVVRLRVRVHGVVQGVGYRPFAHAMARRFGVAGHVGNDDDGVFLELEGDVAAVEEFVRALENEAPPLARVESVSSIAIDVTGETDFRILPSPKSRGQSTPVSADVAPCADCLRELQDPADRRFGYPFVNCTNCGPRYTIVRDVPYDRVRTTMCAFRMCAECQQEYDDPANRRYHAQPNACPVCGPSLTWMPGVLEEVPAAAARDHALRAAMDALSSGRIVAVKGIGGFHLACDATNPDAVSTLRTRKQRSDKPLALLVRDVTTAEHFVALSDEERKLIEGAERPIVLLERRTDALLRIADNVAPGQSTLGVMLPPSPLHYLLAAFGPLVLTSGNISDEPIVRENEEAKARLGRIADGFLLHDRPIHVVCDDSVVLWHEGGELPIRRSRGYAPYPVRLAREVPSVLAVGAELKATACLTRERHAFLTPHIGDLGNLETMDALERACDHLERLFRVHPSLVACDLHPGYLSTRWATERARERGLPLVRAQHHHAHLAALIAEHGLPLDETILAFTFDGTGFGTDGTIWGGEVLLGSARAYERVAHLAETPLPGGDAAIRHPARVALAQLWASGTPWDGTASAASLATAEQRILLTQLERGLNCVDTSSMGRFLDAASSLAGVRHATSYEGQAAIEFERLAKEGAEGVVPYEFGLLEGAPLRFDGADVLRRVAVDAARRRPTRDIARAVHEGIVRIIVAIAARIRAERGVDRVGLTGGVFQNVLLLSRATEHLREAGFTVLRHHRVPPNDGGLALGQAVIAAASEGLG